MTGEVLQLSGLCGIDSATGKELFIKKDGTYSFSYDVNDEVVVGDTEPDIEGLFGTTFYYKGFSLSCFFRYQIGGQLFNTSLFDKVENIGTEEVYNNQDKRALYNRCPTVKRSSKVYLWCRLLRNLLVL